MSSELRQKLENVNGHRSNRQETAQFILDNPTYFKELLEICYTISNPDSYKACWVLEFVAYEKLQWFPDYLDFFCQNLKNLTDESSIRPMAKVTQLLLKFHFKNSESCIKLTESQLQNCIEINFDWLITNTKVATKAYAMRNLFLLGKHYDWIHSELKQIITKDYNDHSAAYKAVAREVLNKINNPK
jgi:hypothetical protein